MEKIHLIEAFWADAHIAFIVGADTTDRILLPGSRVLLFMHVLLVNGHSKLVTDGIASLSRRHAKDFANRTLGLNGIAVLPAKTNSSCRNGLTHFSPKESLPPRACQAKWYRVTYLDELLVLGPAKSNQSGND